MTALLLAEHDNAALAASTARALTAAHAIPETGTGTGANGAETGAGGGDVHVLVAGKGCRAVAEAAARLDGVAKVWLAEADHLAHFLAEEMAALIAPLMADYDVLLAPASTTGKNILPRVAALLDVAQVSDIVAVEAPDTFLRPIYAGNAMQIVRAIDAKKVITVRTTAFSAAGERSDGGVAEIAIAEVPAPLGLSAFEGAELSSADRPELTSARIVVSGGRGLQSGENFAMIERIADRLGAAVGASRAAVDAGYVPNDYQVGQTGKVVAPELYIAVGISGAIQHLAGMKDSKIIVAINKDEDAPIFQVADYGLVGDLFQILPELELELERAGF